MAVYHFTVDAELLRELGERLVGRPHIALAELIKNSYDADATVVNVDFRADRIVVVDDGHGMTEESFRRRWMRLGTTEKKQQQFSPGFKRRLTGSKGVGRLAAQILARRTEIASWTETGKEAAGAGATLNPAFVATIDWDSIVAGHDLRTVSVDLVEEPKPRLFADGSLHGTSVGLIGLNEDWDAQKFRDLAREIWALRPPYVSDGRQGMSVTLTSDRVDIEDTFGSQMDAILDIWSAKIKGRLLPIGSADKGIQGGVLPPRLDPVSTAGEIAGGVDAAESGADLGETDSRGSDVSSNERLLEITINLRGKPPKIVTYVVYDCPIEKLEYEIRVFSLKKRQPAGIKVSDAREYLGRFGGVGIYDEGFKLPYYGVDQDWLNSERDFSRRLDGSALVPEELSVRRGLLSLPANGRLFGWVNISTGEEERAARKTVRSSRDVLTIQVTRDRLVDNAAYQQLRVMVRAGLDLYAMEDARVKLLEAARGEPTDGSPPKTHLDRLAQTIDAAKVVLPSKIYSEISGVVKSAQAESRRSQHELQAYASILGALATAGSTSLAYEHEMSKQIASLRDLTENLQAVALSLPAEQSESVLNTVARMQEWQKRVRGIRAVFGPLLSKESRERVERYRAAPTVRSVVKQISPLARGIRVNTTSIPENLMLPPAALPAWFSIFQNVLINSYNALDQVAEPRVVVEGSMEGVVCSLAFLDNGAGVDLDSAEQLWKPFERRLKLRPELEAAGLGGMGLGLTIVKMIADQTGVGLKFVEPPNQFSTKLEMQWKVDSDA